jgi:hypothetical protein
MNNSSVIEQLRSEVSPFLEKLSDRSNTEFRLKDLEIADSGIYLKDTRLHGRALNNVLGTLRVKKNFVDLSNKMTPDDWSQVSQKLKNAEGDTKMYATFSHNDQGTKEIINTYTHRDGKKNPDTASYQQYFDWIEKNLSESEKEYSLEHVYYNNKGESFDITLLNNTENIDVFGTGLDMWKGGDRFRFSGLQFNYAPFLKRLVCANGATATEFGYGSNISKTTWNNKKIQSVIEKAIKFGNEMLPTQIQEAVQHLKNNNVSIQEFYNYRNFLENRNKDGKYTSIIEKYFNDRPFYQNYGVNIEQKSRKWKSSANSGLNGYQFFNTLTYIASHPDKVRIDREDRLHLQVAASNLLFKRELDLEDVATPNNFAYPQVAEVI